MADIKYRCPHCRRGDLTQCDVYCNPDAVCCYCGKEIKNVIQYKEECICGCVECIICGDED